MRNRERTGISKMGLGPVNSSRETMILMVIKLGYDECQPELDRWFITLFLVIFPELSIKYKTSLSGARKISREQNPDRLPQQASITSR